MNSAELADISPSETKPNTQLWQPGKLRMWVINWSSFLKPWHKEKKKLRQIDATNIADSRRTTN